MVGTEQSKRLLKCASGWGYYWLSRFRGLGSPAAGRPRVHFRIHSFVYARYIYPLFKFLELEGYEVTIAPLPVTMHHLRRTQYGNLVISEGIASFQRERDGDIVIADEGSADRRILPTDFLPPSEEHTYDVPIPQHPLMYSRGLWNRAGEGAGTRIPSILFVGNSDPNLYRQVGESGLFGVIDRVGLWKVLGESPSFQEGNVESVRRGDFQRKVVMLDSRFSRLPFELFRELLGRYSFFLCAPGVVMPLAHNLAEALSAGCVPVIQGKYNELLSPPLSHGINAIVFEDAEDLLTKVEEALGMGEEATGRMSEAVLAYYEDHMSPTAVVRRMLAPETKALRIVTEHHSVRLLAAARGKMES